MNVLAPSPPAALRADRLIDFHIDLKKRGPELTDERLAERLSGGDEDALREAYDRFSRPVFGLLVRFLGDRAAAEDVQQQVFTEVWQKAGNFDSSRGSMLSWVMTIARSRALDQVRKRVPEPREPARTAELVDNDPRSDEIDRLLDAFQFAQLLDHLPDDEAELIRYRFQNELSQSEISQRTGIPLGTVKSRMVSALGRLRTLMEAEA